MMLFGALLRRVVLLHGILELVQLFLLRMTIPLLISMVLLLLSLLLYHLLRNEPLSVSRILIQEEKSYLLNFLQSQYPNISGLSQIRLWLLQIREYRYLSVETGSQSIRMDEKHGSSRQIVRRLFLILQRLRLLLIQSSQSQTQTELSRLLLQLEMSLFL